MEPAASLGIASIITAIFGYWIGKRKDDTKRLISLQDKLVEGYESRIKYLEQEIDEIKRTEHLCMENTAILMGEIGVLKTKLESVERHGG